MSYFKKIHFLCPLFFFLLVPAITHAYTILSQTNLDTSFNNWDSGFTGQTFRATYNGTINSISVPFWRWQNVSGFGALCSICITEKGISNDTCASSQQLTATEPTENINTWTTYSTSSSGLFEDFNIVADEDYWIYLSCGNATQFRNTNIKGTLSDDITNGQFGTSTDRGTTINNGTSMLDIGLVVNIGLSDSIIEFTDTPTSTCNFANWKIQPNFSDADFEACGVTSTCSQGVAYNYGTDSTTTYPFNYNYGGLQSYENIIYLPKQAEFTSGTIFNARAYMCRDNTRLDCFLGVETNENIFAVSENWEFVVNGLDTCTTTYFSSF